MQGTHYNLCACTQQVCEGLPSGEYEIKSAGPEDLEVSGFTSASHPLVNATETFKGLSELTVCPCWCVQKMVLHAMALQNGATSKEIAESAATEKPSAEGGLLGKITGLFRGS